MYRLYGEVPKLGDDGSDSGGIDWSGLLTTATTDAVQYAQAQQKATQAAAAAAAQQKAVAAQTALVQQQTALQKATAAAKAIVTQNPVATGTIVAVGIGAVALFFFMRKKGKK